MGRSKASLDEIFRARPIVGYLAHGRTTVIASTSTKWFRRVEEAAEQHMKRWFVNEKADIDKRLLRGTIGNRTYGTQKKLYY